MRTTRLLVGLLAAALAVSLAPTTAASPTQKQSVRLLTKPKLLPKKKRRSVRLRVITNTWDPGSPTGVPSPARVARVNFDNAYLFRPWRARKCAIRRIAGKTGGAAARSCPRALVGAGSAIVQVPQEGAAPTTYRAWVKAFNTFRRGGRPALILYSYVPALNYGQPLIGVLRFSRFRRNFGRRLDVTIPPLPLGASLTRFDVRVGNGFKWGYVMARCKPTRLLRVRAWFRYEDGGSRTAWDRTRCWRRG